MRDGVRRGQERAVRVRDERHVRQAEVTPHRVEVGNLLRRVQRRRIGRQGGASRAALVIEDDRVPLGERGEVVGNALQVDARAAMDGHQGVGAVPHGTVACVLTWSRCHKGGSLLQARGGSVR